MADYWMLRSFAMVGKPLRRYGHRCAGPKCTVKQAGHWEANGQFPQSEYLQRYSIMALENDQASTQSSGCR